MRPAKPKTVPRLAETAFVVWCEDKDGADDIRQRALDGHLAYIEAHFDRYLVAGPLRRDGEERLSGSLFVILAGDEAEARAFMQGDPYVAEGAYRDMRFRKVTPAAGRWMGGVIWDGADSLRARAKG